MRDHVTPILKALHWLPITQRVKYKILVLTHKCIYEKSAQEYLEKLLHKYNPTRLLRSSADTSKLSVPSYDKKRARSVLVSVLQYFGIPCQSFSDLTKIL